MDVDSIFNLFTQNDQDVLAEHNSAIPIDTSVSQFISIIFAIENYQLLDTLYCFKYPDKYKYVRDEVQLLYYTNIIKSLSKQGVLRSQDVVTILSELSIDRVVQALNEVLYYMEQKELYNECSIIFKFVQLFNVN